MISFWLLGDELYSGVATDLMGRDFTIFRSLGQKPSIRTEQHDSRWLNGMFGFPSSNQDLLSDRESSKLPNTVQWALYFNVWAISVVVCTCFAEPKFISAFAVPESENPDDDKVFFFFRETAVEAQGFGKVTYARIGQLCRVSRMIRMIRMELIYWQQQKQKKLGFWVLEYYYKCLNVVCLCACVCCRMTWEGSVV